MTSIVAGALAESLRLHASEARAAVEAARIAYLSESDDYHREYADIGGGTVGVVVLTGAGLHPNGAKWHTCGRTVLARGEVEPGYPDPMAEADLQLCFALAAQGYVVARARG